MLQSKRFVALLLCCCMTLLLLPATALAAAYYLNISEGSITFEDGKVTYGGGTEQIITASDTIVITGTSTTADTITVTGGTHSITLNNVNISTGGCAFSIALGATVHLTLEGTNTLSSGSDYAGLQVPGTTVQGGSPATLTITGSGSLTATGGVNAAGVGGGNDQSGGTITIYGGTVHANGGVNGTNNHATNGAGIGGGRNGSGGTITIHGGTVNAMGSNQAAGIGGGSDGSGGTITIHGGTVDARSYGDDGHGAGIGGGRGSSGGTIIIHGGTVFAQGNLAAAGIGGGNNGDCGSITINGGTVTAISSTHGAGIGGGRNGSGGSIAISGGTVTAQGGSQGAGIGGCDQGYADSINLTGGIITATSGGNTPGVGDGEHYSGTDDRSITVNGNVVLFATKEGTASEHITGASASAAGMTYTFTNGVVFQGTAGTMQGDVTLAHDLEIPDTHTLVISAGNTLTVPNGVTLTNNDTIEGPGEVVVEAGGTFTNSGTLNGVTVEYHRTIAAPTAANIGPNSITLGPASITPSASGDQVEYAYSTDSTVTATSTNLQWQASGTFDNLNPGTTYYFWARVLENTSTDITYAEIVSPRVTFTTTNASGQGDGSGSSGGGGYWASSQYAVLEGGGASWQLASSQGLRFRSEGPYGSFIRLRVDGAVVEPVHYTVEEGSTIVTIKPSYLNTLSPGAHTLRMEFQSGYSETVFTIGGAMLPPQTGDASSAAVGAALTLAAMGVAVIYTVIYRRKRAGA